jgi:hypothetical protein
MFSPLTASKRSEVGRGIRNGNGRVANTAWYAALAIAALGIIALQTWSIREQSFTQDEPYHLLAGYQALEYGTNTINLEHPPLVKLVAAAPLLAANPPMSPPVEAAGARSAAEALFREPRFVGLWRLETKTTVAIVFGGLLLWACFLFGREVGGRAVGISLALLVGLSFAPLPHFSIVQTDIAVTGGFLLTVLAAVRFVRRPSMRTGLATGVTLGLAIAIKFSALLLIPTVFAALALATAGTRPLRRLMGGALALLVGTLAVPLAVYAAANWHYDPARNEATVRAYCEGRASMVVDDRLRPWEEPLVAVARWAPGVAQYLTGALAIREQDALATYQNLNFGEMRSHGRWWYHPVMFLIKTPLAILLVIAAAAAALLRCGRSALTVLNQPVYRLVSVTTAGYLLAAMSSNYNIGSRHLLPITPFLYLPAAIWLARGRLRTIVVAAVLLGESLALGPFWLQATNTWWLGQRNPLRFAAVTGEYEWKQNFIALAEAAKRKGIEHLHVVYQAPPSEIAAYFPSGDRRTPADGLQPGWYAVSIALQRLLAAFPEASPKDLYKYSRLVKPAGDWKVFMDTLKKGDDQGVIGGTFHLYHLTGCLETATTLCLWNGRFQVEATYSAVDGRRQGPAGTGKAVALTPASGYFWFFDGRNAEVVVKVIDDCKRGGHFWTLAAGLTNLRVALTVTDTTTGVQKTYTSPPGSAFRTIDDTEAFACGAFVAPTLSLTTAASGTGGRDGQASSPTWSSPPARSTGAGTCVMSPSRLCLGDGRFEVKARFDVGRGGQTGDARAVAVTRDTGYLWFFEPNNVEIMVKVVDGCDLNRHAWFFAAGLTRVGVTMTVTDTGSGATRTYAHRAGVNFEPIQDTEAFPACP